MRGWKTRPKSCPGRGVWRVSVVPAATSAPARSALVAGSSNMWGELLWRDSRRLVKLALVELKNTRPGRIERMIERTDVRRTRHSSLLTALLVALMPALMPAPMAAQTEACPAPEALEGEADGPMRVVRYLSADALEGRLAGSPAERCAADYIEDRMRALGLEPAAPAGFAQPVALASSINPHAPRGTGHNIVGVLPGRAAPEGGYVIVGAHYDHLGRGGFGSLSEDTLDTIHNGADDNASGVAALLEAARLLSAGEPLAVPVVFVAFTGEEFGLLGSAEYVRASPFPLEAARAMINLDMVGRLEGDPLIVSGTGTAAEWPELLERRAAEAGIELVMEPEGYGPSDHTSFYTRDVPVLHLFTNVHAEYHRPTDDWQRIDDDGLERIAGLVAALVRDVAGRSGALTLVRGAGEPPARGGGGYGAYLGSVPDFAPVDYGVRLSGVSDDSPAEKAGLRAGDILVRLGEHDIADLYALTDALRAHDPGDVVEVVVVRADERIPFSVTLGARN